MLCEKKNDHERRPALSVALSLLSPLLPRGGAQGQTVVFLATLLNGSTPIIPWAKLIHLPVRLPGLRSDGLLTRKYAIHIKKGAWTLLS